MDEVLKGLYHILEVNSTIYRGDEMKLHKILELKRISIKELSQLTGIKYHTIHKCCSKKTHPSVKNAKIIAKALGIKWYTLFEDEETTED